MARLHPILPALQGYFDAAICTFTLCLHVQGHGTAAAGAGAPAVVLHLGKLPPIQLSRQEVAALTLETLADIWKVRRCHTPFLIMRRLHVCIRASLLC